MKTIAAIMLFTALTSGAYAQVGTMPSMDPIKSVTLTLGEIQVIIDAMVADARAQDAHQRAAAAFAKMSKQIEPEPSKTPEKEHAPPGPIPTMRP